MLNDVDEDGGSFKHVARMSQQVWNVDPLTNTVWSPDSAKKKIYTIQIIFCAILFFAHRFYLLLVPSVGDCLRLSLLPELLPSWRCCQQTESLVS